MAIILINIVGPAGNSSFGLEYPSEQQAQYQAVIDSINADGGVACRKLTPVFYTGNPADSTNLQALCTDIIAAHPFFVIDFGAYYTSPQIASCYPEAAIPFYSSFSVPLKEANEFYPYLFAKDSKEMVYRDAALALGQRGFFSSHNGFKKLGLIYTDCVPELPGEVVSYFEQAGLSSSQIDRFDVGCPSAFASPSVLEQAIVQFKSDGVTAVSEANDEGDFSNFTIIAQQQDFHPKYGLADDGITTTQGSDHPDYSNIADAIAITPDRFGEEDTPGLSPDSTTRRCDAIMTAHNLPSTYASPDGASGQVCDNIWLLQAAINNAPALQHADLAAGLRTAATVAYAYPYGPNNFTGQGIIYGGETWRVDQFRTSCDCFQVIDPTFHSPFP